MSPSHSRGFPDRQRTNSTGGIRSRTRPRARYTGGYSAELKGKEVVLGSACSVVEPQSQKEEFVTGVTLGAGEQIVGAGADLANRCP